MIKKPYIVLFFILGCTGLVIADQYKEEVSDVKTTTPSKAETKLADFQDNYKVEKDGEKSERDIASEKKSESSDYEAPQFWRTSREVHQKN